LLSHAHVLARVAAPGQRARAGCAGWQPPYLADEVTLKGLIAHRLLQGQNDIWRRSGGVQQRG
jgi:hypothetical protein